MFAFALLAIPSDPVTTAQENVPPLETCDTVSVSVVSFSYVTVMDDTLRGDLFDWLQAWSDRTNMLSQNYMFYHEHLHDKLFWKRDVSKNGSKKNLARTTVIPLNMTRVGKLHPSIFIYFILTNLHIIELCTQWLD